MTPITDFDGELIRDSLTKGQIHWIKSERDNGKMILVELCSLDGSFAGYHPMNAKLRDGLKIKYNKDGSLSHIPFVVGG